MWQQLSIPKVAGATLEHLIEHKVQKGEWLCDISRRHNVDLRTLLKANPTLMDPDSLLEGSLINIPHVENGNECMSRVRCRLHTHRALLTQPTTLFATQLGSLTLSKVFLLVGLFFFKRKKHRVIEGDSLEGIAEKYNTTVSVLKKLNKLDDDVIYTGSILEVDHQDSHKKRQFLIGEKANLHERNAILEHGPVNTPQLVAGSSAESPLLCLHPLLRTAKDVKSPPPELMMIKVKYGDTLAHISCQHGLSICELQQLNNLKDDVIIQGDVLVVSAGPEKKELLELRHGRRRTNRHLFSRLFLSKGSSSSVGGPDNLGNAKFISDGLNVEV